MPVLLLSGDIGGTKTRLSLFEVVGDSDRKLADGVFESKSYSGLAAIVREFADRHYSIAAAGFGVAGPVDEEGVCRATNLPWMISARELEQALSIPRVVLINDFHAIALGLARLEADRFEVLQDAPLDPGGPIALIGAGTGLGEGIALRTNGALVAIASEGGHGDLAPRNELEIDLLRYLLERHSRVSYERVVSGPGIRAIYQFVTDSGRAKRLESTMNSMRDLDPAAVVTNLGLSGADPACVLALDIFVSLYGAEAGNLALKVIPTGGLFIAGGIAPKVIAKLREGSFMHAFLHKGRMSSLLERIRVSVIMDPLAGLVGAAEAARLAALEVST